MTKRREKRERKDEGERGVLITILCNPSPPGLSERLEQAFMALEYSSVTAGNNVTTVLFTGAEMGSLYCLPYLKFN